MDESFIGKLTEILPKSAHKKIPEIMKALADYLPARLDAPGGHLAIDTVEYPGVTVELDASGNAVGVVPDGSWDVTYE